MGFMNYSIILQLDESRSKLLTYIGDLENYGWSLQDTNGYACYKDENEDWQQEKYDASLKTKIASFITDKNCNDIAFELYYKDANVCVSCYKEDHIAFFCFRDRIERQSDRHKSMPIWDAAWYFDHLIMPIYAAHQLSYIGYQILQNADY